MSQNAATTVELKESQQQFLDEMAQQFNLPDRSKALRCLITYAMELPDQRDAIFGKIRCVNC